MDRSRCTLVVLLAVQLLAALVIACLPTPSGRGQELIVGPALGVAFGIVGLMSTWAVLGTFSGVVRWSLCLGGIALVTIALIVLFSRGGGPDLLEVVLVLVSGVSIQFGLVQIALWGLRIGLGFRLRAANETTAETGLGETQFSLRHLMLATTAIAVFLGVAPLMLAGIKTSPQRGPMDWEPFLMFGVLAVFNAALVWLALGAAISHIQPWLGFPLVLALLVPLTTLEILLFWGITGRTQQGDDIFIIATLNYVQFAWQFGCLLALRWAGFRLAGAATASPAV